MHGVDVSAARVALEETERKFWILDNKRLERKLGEK